MRTIEAIPRSKIFGPILEKKCPDCAEIVKADARICRFCRHEFKKQVRYRQSDQPRHTDEPKNPMADREHEFTIIGG
ncbi:hypothetical protein FJW07_29585 [Mesorhizobium sp. B3-1-9]|nr:hypothetical protein FJW07_29585 [Mesorhizobium sp. B3-1-9]